ncbi:hypothetical protein, partial [Streptococcus pneumoniae]|uniref:hypothetical protein n=1 Tax=Streptococcus pneumoniae TaxID=1313 RepID=UPI001E4247FA
DYDQIIALLEKNNYKTLLDQQQSSLGTLWTDNFHFYFEYKSGDEHRSWIIDGSFDGSVPQILQPFLFDLNQMIQIAQF